MDADKLNARWLKIQDYAVDSYLKNNKSQHQQQLGLVSFIQ